MTVGECLRYMREGRGLYIKDVSEILGLSENTLGNWELGRCAIPFEKAVMLCRFYELPVNVLAKAVKEYDKEDVEYRRKIVLEVRRNGRPFRKPGEKEGACPKQFDATSTDGR